MDRGRPKKEDSLPEVSLLREVCRSHLSSVSPSYKREFNSVSNSIDRDFDTLEGKVRTQLQQNERYLRRPIKLKADEQRASSECIGYILTDLSKPKKRIRWKPDPVSFPLTVQYKREKFLGDMEDYKRKKPPLPGSNKGKKQVSFKLRVELMEALTAAGAKRKLSWRERSV